MLLRNCRRCRNEHGQSEGKIIWACLAWNKTINHDLYLLLQKSNVRSQWLYQQFSLVIRFLIWFICVHLEIVFMISPYYRAQFNLVWVTMWSANLLPDWFISAPSVMSLLTLSWNLTNLCHYHSRNVPIPQLWSPVSSYYTGQP